MVEIAIAAKYATTRVRFNIVPLLTLDATATGVRLLIGNDPPSYAGRPCAVSRPAGKVAGVDLANCDLLHDRANSFESSLYSCVARLWPIRRIFSFAAVDMLRIPFLKKLQRGRGVESVVSTELAPDGVFVWRRLDDL